MTRILLNTWRRQGQVLGPVLRDMHGVEVAYSRAIEDAGGLPFLLPQSSHNVRPDAVLGGFDGLLLIGGEDLSSDVSGAPRATIGPNADANRDTWELELLTGALDGGLPVLAICRGMQLLNIAFGGTLLGHMTGESDEHPDIPADVSAAFDFRHDVDLAPRSRIRAAVGTDLIRTNSLHHQAVDRLGHGLSITGTARDGAVEAIETSGAPWCVGVQWHPELMPDDPYQTALVSAFVNTCRARRERGARAVPSPILLSTAGRSS